MDLEAELTHGESNSPPSHPADDDGVETTPLLSVVGAPLTDELPDGGDHDARRVALLEAIRLADEEDARCTSLAQSLHAALDELLAKQRGLREAAQAARYALAVNQQYGDMAVDFPIASAAAESEEVAVVTSTEEAAEEQHALPEVADQESSVPDGAAQAEQEAADGSGPGASRRPSLDLDALPLAGASPAGGSSVPPGLVTATRAVGLPNRGKDCFWLAILQCLRHTPGFLRALNSALPQGGAARPATNLVEASAKVLWAMEATEADESGVACLPADSDALSEFRLHAMEALPNSSTHGGLVQWGSEMQHQQDAHEFLQQYLDYLGGALDDDQKPSPRTPANRRHLEDLEKELTEVAKRRAAQGGEAGEGSTGTTEWNLQYEYSMIQWTASATRMRSRQLSAIFEGQCLASMCCGNCGRVAPSGAEPSAVEEVELRPPVPGLFAFFRETSLETLLRRAADGPAEGYRCPNTACGHVGSSSRKVRFLRLPSALVIHVNRAQHGGGRIGAAVRFDEKIDLKDMGLVALHPLSRDLEACNTTYSLYACVFHSGASARSGHYFAYIFVDGLWLCVNDRTVSVPSAEGRPGSPLDLELSSDGDYGARAVLLFYWRDGALGTSVNPWATKSPVSQPTAAPAAGAAPSAGADGIATASQDASFTASCPPGVAERPSETEPVAPHPINVKRPVGLPNRSNDGFWLAILQCLRHAPGFATAMSHWLPPESRHGGAPPSAGSLAGATARLLLAMSEAEASQEIITSVPRGNAALVEFYLHAMEALPGQDASDKLIQWDDRAQRVQDCYEFYCQLLAHLGAMAGGWQGTAAEASPRTRPDERQLGSLTAELTNMLSEVARRGQQAAKARRQVWPLQQEYGMLMWAASEKRTRMRALSHVFEGQRFDYLRCRACGYCAPSCAEPFTSEEVHVWEAVQAPASNVPHAPAPASRLSAFKRLMPNIAKGHGHSVDEASQAHPRRNPKLEDLLQGLADGVVVEGYQCPSQVCAKVGTTVRCTQYLRLPAVFVIHVNRAQPDGSRCDSSVEFGAHLNLQVLGLAPETALNRDLEPCLSDYTLFAVAFHNGAHSRTGRHMVYLRIGDHWIAVDDSAVALPRGERSVPAGLEVSECGTRASMLFYSRYDAASAAA